MPFGMLLPPEQQTTPCSPFNCQSSAPPDYLWRITGSYFFVTFTLSLYHCHSIFSLPPFLLPFPPSRPTFTFTLPWKLQPQWQSLLEVAISKLKNEYEKKNACSIAGPERCTTALERKGWVVLSRNTCR